MGVGSYILPFFGLQFKVLSAFDSDPLVLSGVVTAIGALLVCMGLARDHGTGAAMLGGGAVVGALILVVVLTNVLGVGYMGESDDKPLHNGFNNCNRSRIFPKVVLRPGVVRVMKGA
jgi:hypothetical protein